MADKKISQLTALSAANLAPSTDVLAIVDTSATETKKIVAQDLINGVLNVASAVGIGTTSPGAKLHVLGSNFVGIFAGTNANTVYTEYRYNSTTTSGFIGNGSSVLSAAADSDFIVRSEGALKFATNGNNFRAVIDTSGNLGLGVTPSLWIDYKALQTTGASFIGYSDGASNNQAQVVANAYFTTGSAWKYIYTDHASRYMQYDGEHRWFTAPSWDGTGSNAISFTQAMTLDASGQLALGTSTASTTLGRNLTINGASAGTNSGIVLQSAGTERGYAYASDTQMVLGSSTSIPLLMLTGGTERGRFTSAGYFKASDSGTYRNAAGVYHELRNSDGSNPTVFVTNSNASTPYGIAVEFTAAAPDNNTQFFFRAEDNVAIRCYIWADGDLANHDGVYGTISDERLKQDIVDAGSQWDDLKSIRFRKYRMKTDVEANPDAPAMFGVVAQELAQVCPGLVDEHPNMKTVEVTDEEGNVTQTQEPDGTTTLTVKSSILLMKAAKALQEAMARIEQLEADMAALKASA